MQQHAFGGGASADVAETNHQDPEPRRAGYGLPPYPPSPPSPFSFLMKRRIIESDGSRSSSTTMGGSRGASGGFFCPYLGISGGVVFDLNQLMGFKVVNRDGSSYPVPHAPVPNLAGCPRRLAEIFSKSPFQCAYRVPAR